MGDFSLDQVSKSKGCYSSLSLNAKTGDTDNGSGDLPSVTTMEFFLGVLQETALLVTDEDLGTSGNCSGNLSIKLDLYSLPSVCLLLLLCFEILFA